MKETMLDANILLRFLVKEDEKQNECCTALMKRIADGEEKVFLHDLALADVIWTLKSYYKQPKEEIRRIIETIVALKGINMTNKDQVFNALQLFDESSIDWTDAVLAAYMFAHKKEIIYSYDRDFDRLDAINRQEPTGSKGDRR